MGLMSKMAFTVREAAAESGHSDDQIRAAIRDGKLPARMTGQQLIILAADLSRYLSSLPSLHDISAQAQREAKAKSDAEARERGREIALQATGKAPPAPRQSAAERERERQERVAHEMAARARGRAIVERAQGKK